MLSSFGGLGGWDYRVSGIQVFQSFGVWDMGSWGLGLGPWGFRGLGVWDSGILRAWVYELLGLGF